MVEVNFNPMHRFPKPNKDDERLSEIVMVYEVDDYGEIVDIDFGWYDFSQSEWNVLGENSMKLSCWCYPPDPKTYLAGKNFKTTTHKGYC